MLTCKLCGTDLTRKNLCRDGSMLCPVCGQKYWKAAVDKAIGDISVRNAMPVRAIRKRPALSRI